MENLLNNNQVRKCVKATIQIPYHLRKLVNDQKALYLNIYTLAPTVGDVIEVLYDKYPSLAKSLIKDDGKLYGFLSLYLNGKNIKYLEEFDTRLKEVESKIAIRASIAGG